MSRVRSKTAGPGRPKDMEKRAAILEAAKRLFTEKGFEGTSMDAVAGAAGVSKLTVYSHFGDKDTLFREAIRQRCQEVLPDHLYAVPEEVSPREALLELARHHARVATSPESIGVWRAITSDCRNGSPRMGRLLWEEGPERAHVLMKGFLDRLVEAGKLDIADTSRAAAQFHALVKGDLHFRRMFGCVEKSCQDFEGEVMANAEAAVEMFLRAYTPR
ncbi:TetR/AcrR family transcriptional regulator [Oleiagrimonas sp. C23AA]|uniref:TetR/AcrR family transcriptional regulator n=1 Tax=Oleiagrimonas sp. C23AA TaxID=2719047 RepID=UPI00141ED51E|nr:TetR/AcrR family transcriptional regulator [Oleiagrimonas sp. C23AA]NII12288.1 TetR family transcriptional regulator [Oleiagrimonas sp. C23AA]